MGKKLVTDDEIKTIHKRIKSGESIGNLTSEFGISRQAYYQRTESLGIKTRPKRRIDRLNAVDVDNIEIISDMYDLAALLNLDFKEVHNVVVNEKGIESNIKRINHLKKHSPKKFQEAVSIIILKHFDISPVELIKILEQKKNR